MPVTAWPGRVSPLPLAGAPPSAFTQGLRAARASGLALAAAAAGWAGAAGSAPFAEAFLALRDEAEEAVHRAEFILAGLRRGALGGTSWIGRPAIGPAAPSPGANDIQDARHAALAAEALERVAAETLTLGRLAHDLGEYQAARLLRLSAEGAISAARRLLPLTSPGTKERP